MDSREDGSPSWGRKLCDDSLFGFRTACREDGSPSWGRKQVNENIKAYGVAVEKMGPLRGDGNTHYIRVKYCFV